MSHQTCTFHNFYWSTTRNHAKKNKQERAKGIKSLWNLKDLSFKVVCIFFLFMPSSLNQSSLWMNYQFSPSASSSKETERKNSEGDSSSWDNSSLRVLLVWDSHEIIRGWRRWTKEALEDLGRKRRLLCSIKRDIEREIEKEHWEPEGRTSKRKEDQEKTVGSFNWTWGWNASSSLTSSTPDNF
jgi:hypothetical protein